MPIYTHSYHDLPLTTGDIICTQDGESESVFGRLWKLLGLVVPGEVDHCILYLGPGGRCIESAPSGMPPLDSISAGCWTVSTVWLTP